MTNAKQAYPSIEIVCEDRTRTFCLNLGAFRALEEYMAAKTGNSDFNILDDFDWSSKKVENLCLISWAGLYTDSRKAVKAGIDSQTITVEDVEDIVSLVGLGKIRGLIEESLQRVMTQEQFTKMKEEASKKKPSPIKAKARSSRAG